MEETKVANGARLLAGSFKRAWEKRSAAEADLRELQDELEELGGSPFTAPTSALVSVQVLGCARHRCSQSARHTQP